MTGCGSANGNPFCFDVADYYYFGLLCNYNQLVKAIILHLKRNFKDVLDTGDG